MGGGSEGPRSFGDVSTISLEGSMVEIRHREPEQQGTPEQYQLLYSKSKVAVHPTSFTRDNILGFVAIVKKARCQSILGVH